MLQILDVTLGDVLSNLTLFSTWFIEQIIALSNFFVTTPLGLILLGVFVLPTILTFLLRMVRRRGH